MLVFDQKVTELVGGHYVSAGGELGEEFLDIGRWAQLSDLELAVEEHEHFVIVGGRILVAHLVVLLLVVFLR